MAMHRECKWPRAVALLVLGAAIITPVGVAWRDAIVTNYDSPPEWIHGGFLVGAILLLAVFAPAVNMAVRYSPDLYTLAASTTVILGCVTGMFAWVYSSDSPTVLLAFPLAGAAASLGAWTANIYVPEWADRRQHR